MVTGPQISIFETFFIKNKLLAWIFDIDNSFYFTLASNLRVKAKNLALKICEDQQKLSISFDAACKELQMQIHTFMHCFLV